MLQSQSVLKRLTTLQETFPMGTILNRLHSRAFPSSYPFANAGGLKFCGAVTMSLTKRLFSTEPIASGRLESPDPEHASETKDTGGKSALMQRLYSKQIQGLIKSRNFDLVEDVLKDMKLKSVKPNLHIMNQLLNIASQKGDVPFSEELFREMERYQMNPNVHSYGCLMKAYINKGDMNGAMKILRKMKEIGINPNSVVMNTLLNGYAVKMKRNEAIGVLEEMKLLNITPTPFSITPLIRMESAFGDLAGVTKYWNMLTDITSKPSAFCHAFLVEAYTKCHRFDLALSTHYTIRNLSDVTDVTLGLSYMYLFQFCAILKPRNESKESDNEELASLVYAHESDDGRLVASVEPMYPNQDIACGKELTVKLYDDMKSDPRLSQSFQPPSALCSSVLTALFRHTSKHEVVDVVEEYYNSFKKRYNVKDDIFLFSPRVSAFCKAGKIDQATLLIKQMEKEGVTPDLSVLNIIINGYALESKPHFCWKIFTEMKNRNHKPDQFTITSLFRSFFKPKGQVAPIDQILQIEEEMNELNIKHSVFTYNAMIVALRDNGHTQAAIEKFNDLLNDKSLKPSERSYNTGLSIPLTDFANSLQASELCMKILKDLMDKRKFVPTIVTINTLLKACALSRDDRRARKALDWIREYSLTPTCWTLLRAVHTFVRVHKHEEAANTIKEMFALFPKESSKVPVFIDLTQLSYKFVLQGLCSSSLSKHAEDLHNHFAQQQQPIRIGFYEGISSAAIQAGNVRDAYKFFLIGMNAGQVMPIKLYLDIRDALSKIGLEGEMTVLDRRMSSVTP